MSDDEFAGLVNTLGADDIAWLVAERQTLVGIRALIDRRREQLQRRLSTLLEYRNGGEKAIAAGRYLGADGAGYSFQVTFKPGGMDRKWDQGRLKTFLELLGKDKQACELGLASKHFKTEIACRNIRNARLAIEPLGGEIRDRFLETFNEWQKEPELEIVVERSEAAPEWGLETLPARTQAVPA